MGKRKLMNRCYTKPHRERERCRERKYTEGNTESGEKECGVGDGQKASH